MPQSSNSSNGDKHNLSPSDVDRRSFLRTAGAATTLGMTGFAGCLGGSGNGGNGSGNGGSKSITAFVWEGYGPILKQFEEESGITVNKEIATSTNKMFTKAQSAPGNYDVVVPNSGYVTKFQDAGLVQPVASNTDKMTNEVPNFTNTYEYFRQGTIKDHLTDKKGRWYGIPPRFGLYGLAYDSNKINGNKLQSSADLWKNKSLWQGDVGVNIDPVHSITHAVRALGYTDMLRGDQIRVTGKAWKETRKKFLELADSTRAMYESEAQLGRALKGNSYNVAVGPGRNDIINLIKKGNKNFKYVNPKEGAVGWTEALLMMKKSNAKEEVKKFMNFFLTPETGAMLATTDLSPSTVAAAKKKMTKQQIDLFWISPKIMDEVIQDKSFAEPQKWKQLKTEFKGKL